MRLAHLDEGVAGLAHLARAAGTEVDLAPLAEAFGRLRQPQDRPDLVAQEERRRSPSSTSEVPTIQNRKMCEFDA